MHPAIVQVNHVKRGCGFRDKPGRLYLTSDLAVSKGCGKLPVPLEVCPCCGMGVKPSRTPTWLEQPENLWRNLSCTGKDNCSICPMSNGYETGGALLIWIGEKFYNNASDFCKEAASIGISRHINHVPRQFKVGETWVLLAHRKAIELNALQLSPEPVYQAGIFGMFRPNRIEITVTGDEPDSVIDGYVKRGLTPVLVYKATPKSDKPKDSEIKQESLL